LRGEISNRLFLFARISALAIISGLILTSFAWSQKPTPSPLAIARTQATKGDLDAAEKTLWTILGPDPNNLEALNMLGAIRAQQQRYPEAESLFRRVLRLDPKQPAAAKNLAGVLLAENKPDEAIGQMAEAAKLAPHDYELKAGLARLYSSRGDYKNALATFDSIPAVHFPVTAVPDKAAALIAIGKKTEATALVPSVRTSPQAALDLAEVFVAGSMPAEALKSLALLPVSGKHPARYYNLKGSALEAKGEFSAAQKNFQQALADDPKSVDTLAALAESYAREGRHADAVTMLQRAHETDPDSVPVLRHLVEESMRAGQYGRALQAATQLQNKSPDNPEDQYMVAAVDLQVQKFLEAAGLFEKYVVARPQDPRGFLGLGVAYLNRQNYDGARQAFQKALGLEPGFTEARYQLGVVTNKEGNSQQAIQIFEQVLQQDPRHAESLVAVGALYFQAGELEKARQSLERATQADPKDPDAEYQLSLVLNRMGQTDQARQHMERFRTLKAEKDRLQEQQRAIPSAALSPN
jgi:tetratricopeptide (TPR) repeat protein